MKTHPCRLRPYHNPENVDESLVPEGWRFRYADEVVIRAGSHCRAFIGLGKESFFDECCNYLGTMLKLTYIVPVDC